MSAGGGAKASMAILSASSLETHADITALA
jgi:hypothetical protein